MDPGWSAAERAARESYGRLVAWLARRWRDVAAAEDAMSEALAAALVHWPRDGVPAVPEAWLMTVAKRELLQAERHAAVARAPEFQALFDLAHEAPIAPAVPDERLKLMFVCAHPQVPARLHAPLMLQVVLGLDAQTIANAFLTSPAAMAQRLVRAKAGLRAAGVRYEEPEARELSARLSAVLDGIYGAYTIGSNVAACAPAGSQFAPLSDLCAEALYLAEIVTALLPDVAEALALRALMLYCEARRPAQFAGDGRFVPLAEQSADRWDRGLLDAAEALLRQAAALGQPGSLQLEAAIQSAHCQRAYGGDTPWDAIAELYAALVAANPGIGARIGQAVALAECGRLAAGIEVLRGIDEKTVASYQPYWVARAYLTGRVGDDEAACSAMTRALGLTADPRIRTHLLETHARLLRDP